MYIAGLDSWPWIRFLISSDLQDRTSYSIAHYRSYSYQTNTANDMLSNIVNIQPKDTGGGSGETRESVVYKLAGDMLDKLPDDYVPHQV